MLLSYFRQDSLSNSSITSQRSLGELDGTALIALFKLLIEQRRDWRDTNRVT
jgi:hypothetical protein